MAGRRTSLASLAGGKVEDVPGRGDATLVTLPPAKLCPSPLNPREDFGTPGELLELGQSMARGQLQPIVVVSRTTYARLFPEHAEQVQTATYVIANGERRYRAAHEAGLAVVEAVIREEVATSRQTFIDALLSENIDRKNFDPIEEAHAIEAMVTEFGSARAVAEHRGKHEAWVSQRRSLLRLAPAVRELVRGKGTGPRMPVETARKLAKAIKDHGLDERAQLEWWEQEQGRPKPDRRRVETPAPRVAVEGGQNLTAVKSPPPPAPTREAPAAVIGQPENLTAVKSQPAPISPPVPSPALAEPGPPVASRESSSGPGRAVEEREPLPELLTVGAVPWGDLPTVAQILTERVRGAGRVELLELLARRWGGELGGEDRRRLAKLLGDD